MRKQFQTFTADKGYYLTQAHETNITEKMFLTSIRGLNLNIDNWVQCTEEYANEVLNHINFLNNINADVKPKKF